MRSRLARNGAAASVVLALAAAVGLALWPCAYRGAEGAPGWTASASSARR